MVLFVVYETLTEDSLNNLVMNFVSLPMYVNFARRVLFAWFLFQFY
jgi:hypothetical protein